MAAAPTTTTFAFLSRINRSLLYTDVGTLLCSRQLDEFRQRAGKENCEIQGISEFSGKAENFLDAFIVVCLAYGTTTCSSYARTEPFKSFNSTPMRFWY